MEWSISLLATAISTGTSNVLLYHPILDPYHCALRALSLLSDSGVEEIEWERFRLLDFLIAFPQTLCRMRLPREYLSRRASLRAVPEPYEQLPNVTRVFYQISEVQAAAMRLLAAAELINRDSLRKGKVSAIKCPNLAPGLSDAMQELRFRSEDWYKFVTECLVTYPLNGNGGLKERTGLMEHRHDFA